MTKQFIVNANFVRLRKEVGLTQELFSGQLKITRSALGSYEEFRAEIPSEVIESCIKLKYLAPESLYDFMFSKKYTPSPEKRFEKSWITAKKKPSRKSLK